MSTEPAVWVEPNTVYRCGEQLFRAHPNGPGGYALLDARKALSKGGALIIAVAGIMNGFVWGLAVSEFSGSKKFGTPAPIKAFTTNELAQESFSDATMPAEIRLHIVPPDEIESHLPGAFAYASYGATGCTITFPSGRPIRVWPHLKSAAWVRQFDGNALAHEILHCLRGSWHP